MNDNYDFTGKSEADILLSYTANKGHRTRQLNKVKNLLGLQEQKYSRITEKTLCTAVRDLNKFTDRLAILTGYLSLYKLEAGLALATEAQECTKDMQEQAEAVYKQIHDHQPNDHDIPAAIAQAGVATYGAKPILVLKPNKLSFDAILGSVRRWKQRFKAFHSYSNLRALPLPDKQAFLIACVDDEVANRISRVATEMTPLFPNNAGNPSCYDTIDSLFREKIPVLLRRVQFMNHKQKEGQDRISWREELRNLTDDADIEDMDTSDLLLSLIHI